MLRSQSGSFPGYSGGPGRGRDTSELLAGRLRNRVLDLFAAVAPSIMPEQARQIGGSPGCLASFSNPNNNPGSPSMYMIPAVQIPHYLRNQAPHSKIDMDPAAELFRFLEYPSNTHGAPSIRTIPTLGPRIYESKPSRLAAQVSGPCRNGAGTILIHSSSGV